MKKKLQTRVPLFNGLGEQMLLFFVIVVTAVVIGLQAYYFGL